MENLKAGLWILLLCDFHLRIIEGFNTVVLSRSSLTGVNAEIFGHTGTFHEDKPSFQSGFLYKKNVRAQLVNDTLLNQLELYLMECT